MESIDEAELEATMSSIEEEVRSFHACAAAASVSASSHAASVQEELDLTARSSLRTSAPFSDASGALHSEVGYYHTTILPYYPFRLQTGFF